MIHLCFLIKHIFFPTEMEAGISITGRFYKEFEMRHWSIINDLITGSINLCINFSEYWKIPAQYIPACVIFLLIFDILKMVYLFLMENISDDYKNKELNTDHDFLIEADKKIMSLLSQQLHAHHAEVYGKRLFSIALNSLLLLNFICSLFFTALISIPIFFLMSTIIISVAQSADHFGQYMRASQDHEQDLQDAEKLLFKYKKRNDFYSHICQNFFMPFMLTGLFTINWLLASSLIFFYFLYQSHQSNFKKKEPQAHGFFLKKEVFDDLEFDHAKESNYKLID